MFNVLLLSKPWPLPGALSGWQLCDNEGTLVDLQTVWGESNKLRLLLPGALQHTKYSAGSGWQTEDSENLLPQISCDSSSVLVLLRRSCHCWSAQWSVRGSSEHQSQPVQNTFLPATGQAQAHLGLCSCQLIFIMQESAVDAWPKGDSIRTELCKYI